MEIAVRTVTCACNYFTECLVTCDDNLQKKHQRNCKVMHCFGILCIMTDKLFMKQWEIMSVVW